MAAPRPVVLLAFANDPADGINYLRNLPEEARRLRSALEYAEAQGLCEFELLYNATLDDILAAFQKPKLRGRIAVFHYGGHADSYELLFQSKEGNLTRIDGRGFAAFLAEQHSLQLVFLNACTTEPQVDSLLAANVQVIIATSQEIDDEAAASLASHFYDELAHGAAIGSAYRQAVAALRAQKGDDPTLFYQRGSAPVVEESSEEPAAPAANASPDASAAAVGPGGSASGGYWPWMLRTRLGAEVAAEWSLPLASGDPLFGLPPLPARPLPDSPYQRGLDYYTREMAELFFGRGREIRSLYQRVTAAGHASTILYYGQSGVGKSSLLDAGLAPRLQATHVVSYARRDRGLGLLGTLRKQLAECGAGAQGTVAEAWRAAEKAAGKPLVLILDQVEEVFTRRNGEQPNELQEFIAALRSIDGGANQPQGALLLGFRKEHLAEIVSALREQRVGFVGQFLAPLDAAGIQEVVCGPVSSERLRNTYSLTLDDDLPESIAHDLTADPDSPVAPTLNILLSKLWAAATAESASSPHFSVPLYHKLQHEGILLEDFLRQQSATIAREQPAAVGSGLLLDLWAFHTTPLGTADQCDAAELRHAYGERAGLDALILRSKELYVLADPPGDKAAQGTRLAHDTLAPLVRRDYEHSTLPGQQARRLLEGRAVDWEGERTGALLDDAALAVIGKGLEGMRSPSAAEQRLLDASRQAQIKRRRQQRLARLLAAAAAAAILALVLAIWLTSESGRISQREAHTNEAQRLAQLARQQLGTDPVSSLYLALAANQTGVDVPEAEYALRQAALTSRERKYITATVRSPDEVAIAGRRIAVGGDLPAVYDLALDAQDFAFPAGFTPILGLRWDKAQERLLGWNGQSVWVMGAQAQQFPLQLADGEQVRCAEWQPGGQWVAICTWNQLYAWEPASGRVITLTAELDTPEQSTEPRSAVWSADGRWLAGLGARLVVWDSESPDAAAQVFYPPQVPGMWVNFAFWLPGNLLVAAWSDLSSGISELETWRPGTSALEAVPVTGDPGARSSVYAVYAPDRQAGTPRILFWSGDGFLALYGIDGQPRAQASGVPLGLKPPILAPGGDLVAGYAADGTATVWSLPALHVFQRLDRTRRFVASSLTSASWLDDETLVLSDNTGLVQVVRMSGTSNELAITPLAGYRANEEAVQTRQVDGGLLLTAGLFDGGTTSLRLWQLDARPAGGLPAAAQPLCERLQRSILLPQGLEGAQLQVIDWQPDGTLLLGNALQVATWQPGGAAQMPPADEQVFGYAVAPDHKQVLRFGSTASEIWQAGPNGWTRAGTLPGTILDAVWTAFGVLAQNEDGSAALIDPASGKSQSLPEGTIAGSSTMLAPDLALAISLERVKVWDLQEGQEVDSWAVPGGERLLLDAAAPDGTLFALRGENFGEVYVLQWDAGQKTLRERWRSKNASVATARSALHPQEPLLATVHNGIVSIVDWEQGKTIWQSSSTAEAAAQYFSSANWSADGKYLVTEATPPQPSTFSVNIGIWRWDEKAGRLILLQELPSSGFLGISPDLQFVLALDPGQLTAGNALIYPVLLDTIQLRQEISDSCLLSRPREEAQQALAVEDR